MTMAPSIALFLSLHIHSISSLVVVPNEMNWTEANRYCADTYGTQLATITNDSETNYLFAATQSYGTKIWIGLNDIDEHGIWKWTSGHSW